VVEPEGDPDFRHKTGHMEVEKGITTTRRQATTEELDNLRKGFPIDGAYIGRGGRGIPPSGWEWMETGRMWLKISGSI